MRPDRVVFLILFCFHVSQGISLWPRPGSGNGALRRRKRQDCHDGSYPHGALTCCLCGTGNHLKEHCTSSTPRKCEPCRDGTFQPHPNAQFNCEPCTFCSSENGLEEAERCTPASDAVCRCQSGHYCSSFKEDICLSCSSCQECEDRGIKAACTATNNTVCNDKIEGGDHLPAILIPIAVVVLVAAIGGFLYFRRRRTSSNSGQVINGNAQHDDEVEMQPMRGTDISRYVADIARELEWGDMKKIAMRSGMTKVDIDNCEQNHPGHTEEQTLELLQKWVESQGRAAQSTLIQSLRQSKKIRTAEKIEEILSRT